MTTKLSINLITDLLSEKLEMLHSGDEAPEALVMIAHPESNDCVVDAMNRIFENVSAYIGIQNIQVQIFSVMYVLDIQRKINPDTLLLFLQYPSGATRKLELTLDGMMAKLHFLK